MPDPSINGGIFPSRNQSVETAAGWYTTYLILNQQLPWCGKLRKRGQVANLNTKIALTQLAEAQLRVIEAVKLAYYNIYLNQQSLRIIDDVEQRLRVDFLEPAEAGKTKTEKLDLHRARVELAKLQEQRLVLVQHLQQAQADLARTLSTAPETDLKVVDTPNLPAVPAQLDRLYQVAMISRPELEGKLQAVSRDERLVQLARLNYVPDLTLGAIWYDVSAHNALSKTADGQNAVGIAVGITLPIWHRKLQAGVREAQYRTAESVRLYQAARDEMLRLIRRLTVQARAQEQQLELYKQTLLGEAEQTLRIASEGYKAGKVNPVRVIENWIQLKTFRLLTVGLEASLGQTLASLERVVGEQLTRMKEPSAAPDCSSPGRLGSEPASEQDSPARHSDEILPLPQRMEAAPSDEHD